MNNSINNQQNIPTENVCYSCGQPAHFVVTKQLKPCCSNHYNKCPEKRRKNSLGGKKVYAAGNRLTGSERYKTLPQSTKDSMAWSRGQTRFIDKQVLIDENILTERSYVSSSRVRILLFKLKLKPQQCECCKITKWQGKPISFELHHINGVSSDNRLDNLTILCPNCHSITENYRGKNIKKQPYKTDQEILHALQINDFNRRKALIYLGLAPKGGNYKRLNKFIQ